MLAEWCRQLAAGKRPLQVHNCDSFLDLSDVRDVVRAYRMLARHVRQQEGPVVETVNVGSGVCYRSGTLLDDLLGLLDQPWEYQELHPGRRQHPIADIGRLQRLTGWVPSVPIERTLADSLEYWRQVDRAP